MKARFTPSLFAHAEAVLNQLLRFDYPADAVVSHYFRDHRELGHADRAFVAETGNACQSPCRNRAHPPGK